MHIVLQIEIERGLIGIIIGRQIQKNIKTKT